MFLNFDITNFFFVDLIYLQFKTHSDNPTQEKKAEKNKSQLLQYPRVVLSACLSKCSGTDIRTNGDGYWEIHTLQRLL